MILHPEFSLATATCHGYALLLTRSYVALIKSKRLKLPCLITCGNFLPMVPSGLILITSLILHPNPPLCTSLRLSRLPREMFQSPCTSLPTVAIFWSKWMAGRQIYVLSKCSPERPKVCEPPTANNLGISKGSAITDNRVVSTPALLECP